MQTAMLPDEINECLMELGMLFDQAEPSKIVACRNLFERSPMRRDDALAIVTEHWRTSESGRIEPVRLARSLKVGYISPAVEVEQTRARIADEAAAAESEMDRACAEIAAMPEAERERRRQAALAAMPEWTQAQLRDKPATHPTLVWGVLHCPPAPTPATE